MEFAILGPLEASREGQSISLGGPKQRALLAVLLLHRNEVVSRDRLIDALWGETPPPTAGQTLDSYVSRLRRLIGGERLVRKAPGYLLRVEPGELDLDRFQQLVGEGAFADALAIWRGAALADLLFEPFAPLEAERLEELRVGALEERIEAELAAGARAELVPELERLVRDHPFRERLLGQLMVALYRAGRQAAALDAYRTAKRRLADELGLEPGPQLQELERKILEHDSDLGRRPGATRVQLRSHRRLAVAAAMIVAVAGTAVGLLLATRGSGNATSAAGETSRVVSLDAGSGRLVRAAELPAAPAEIATAAGFLWLTDPMDGAVLKVDPEAGLVDRIPIAGQPGSLAAGDGAVWVASTLSGRIDRIDPPSSSVSQTIHLGQEHTTAITYARGSLWIADATDRAVIELDGDTGSARRTIPVGIRPSALVVGDGILWVADHDAASVLQVDLGSGQITATIHVGNGPAALALDRTGLWVANSLDSTVSHVDPVTGSVTATLPVASGPAAVAAGGGVIWVASRYAGTITRIDPTRNSVVGTVAVGGQPTAVVASASKVWIGAAPAAAAHRGGTLVLASSSQPVSIDPGVYAQAPIPTFTGLAHDSLVRFAADDGPDGLRLVPDLALQVPAPTGDGRTYTFRLRPGIRYSDGRLLRASDFRRSFERLFGLDSPGKDDFAGIVGAAACRRSHGSRCDLSRGVVTNDAAGTVVVNLAEADPDFLFKLTDFGFSAPLPPGVPRGDSGYQPLPGTGPYRIVAASRAEIRFERNPYFREWSHAAQPAGNPDHITWRYSTSQAEAIRWVAQGRADWSFTLPSPSQLHVLRTRSPAQVHANPIFATEFLPLNTNLPPFDDIRVRQALNFAVDRSRIARMYGGSFIAAPSCQILLPGLIGYRRHCPYTRHPTADGAYHGPDLARAKQLVAASGTSGQRVDVWGASDEVVVPPQLTAYVGGVLRSLGYRVRTHVQRLGSITPAARRGHQMSTDGDWLPAYPAPSSYVIPFFACDGGLTNGYTCNRKLDAEMNEALSLQLADPERAAELWRRVDRKLVELAYWVPTVTDRVVEFVSRRIRNYQFQPAWGSFIADQASLG